MRNRKEEHSQLGLHALLCILHNVNSTRDKSPLTLTGIRDYVVTVLNSVNFGNSGRSPSCSNFARKNRVLPDEIFVYQFYYSCVCLSKFEVIIFFHVLYVYYFIYIVYYFIFYILYILYSKFYVYILNSTQYFTSHIPHSTCHVSYPIF